MVQGVKVTDDGYIVNVNPATGEEISRVACTSTEAVEELYERSVEAQIPWSKRSAEERIQMLRDGLAEIAKQSDQVSKLMVREMGKPLAEAREEMEFAVDKDDYLNILLESLQPIRHGKSSIVVRQALGVVAVLSPWNFPCDEILLLTLPALASGNTVVLKPSEVAPETGALTAQCLTSSLPSNVLQVAQGDGRVGATMVSHASTSMVAMTGSSATGRKILESAAPAMKRLVLELGGKDPMVVFDSASDKDFVREAAKDAVMYSLSNSGQVCCSIERIYVAESIYDDFCRAAVEEARSYQVGNGMVDGVKVGPLVSQMQRDHVRAQVEDAINKGVLLLFHSEVPSGKGSFYPVTVLAGVTEDMKIYSEETFGPVVCISKFDGSEAEGIRLANDTRYGLAACVYSKDTAQATRVAEQIEAGQVGINCYALENMDTACPWVGHKHSGFGYHSGREGFNNFSIPKTLVYSDDAPPSSS